MDALYLLATYVTQEQERAVRSMFSCNGWEFRKEEVMQSLLVIRKPVLSKSQEGEETDISELSEISLLKTRPASETSENVFAQVEGSESTPYPLYSVEDVPYDACVENTGMMEEGELSVVSYGEERQNKYFDKNKDDGRWWQEEVSHEYEYSSTPAANVLPTEKSTSRRKNTRKKHLVPMYLINNGQEDSVGSSEDLVSSNSLNESQTKFETSDSLVSRSEREGKTKDSSSGSGMKSDQLEIIIKKEKTDESDGGPNCYTQADFNIKETHLEADDLNLSDNLQTGVEEEDAAMLHSEGGVLNDKYRGSISEEGGFELENPPSEGRSFPFMCTICGGEFETKPELFVHVKSHLHNHGNSKSTCSYCDKQFTSRTQLRSHMRLHTPDKPFSCPTCEKCFSQAQYLKKHMSIHSGERPYVCEVCGKSFNSAAGKWHHRKIHATVKPYACDICGKSFSRQFSLRSHRAVHIKEPSLSCAICGKACQSAISLQDHLRSHKHFHVVQKNVGLFQR